MNSWLSDLHAERAKRRFLAARRRGDWWWRAWPYGMPRWRRVLADDLSVGFRWRHRMVMLRLGGWYKMLCRMGLHFMHENFVANRWVCACGRNFINNEEIR